jgi:hypothetical protein
MVSPSRSLALFCNGSGIASRGFMTRSPPVRHETRRHPTARPRQCGRGVSGHPPGELGRRLTGDRSSHACGGPTQAAPRRRQRVSTYQGLLRQPGRAENRERSAADQSRLADRRVIQAASHRSGRGARPGRPNRNHNHAPRIKTTTAATNTWPTTLTVGWLHDELYALHAEAGAENTSAGATKASDSITAITYLLSIVGVKRYSAVLSRHIRTRQPTRASPVSARQPSADVAVTSSTRVEGRPTRLTVLSVAELGRSRCRAEVSAAHGRRSSDWAVLRRDRGEVGRVSACLCRAYRSGL